ncbi:MAG: DUF3291 domain-containing protein [Pseudomonadales bacterium]
MNANWHIAQINVGTTLYPTDDDRMSGFMNQLDDINALADQSAGFVWRLQSESGNATDIDVGGPPLYVVNMSVWTSAEALFEFVYKSAHRPVMADRRQWFERPDGAYQALWWVRAGHIPTVEEGLARLELLKSAGPNPHAFNFKTKYPCPDFAGRPDDLEPEPYCSGWE